MFELELLAAADDLNRLQVVTEEIENAPAAIGDGGPFDQLEEAVLDGVDARPIVHLDVDPVLVEVVLAENEGVGFGFLGLGIVGNSGRTRAARRGLFSGDLDGRGRLVGFVEAVGLGGGVVDQVFALGLKVAKLVEQFGHLGAFGVAFHRFLQLPTVLFF